MIIDRRAMLAAMILAAATARGAAAPAPTRPLLDALFQDHAVLQRDKPVPVWGDASPGDQVAVSLSGATIQTRADASGHWHLMLPAMAAGFLLMPPPPSC